VPALLRRGPHDDSAEARIVNLQGTLLRSTTMAYKPVNAVARDKHWQSRASYRPGDAARYGAIVLPLDTKLNVTVLPLDDELPELPDGRAAK
jgi:hypothetical protein